MSKKAYIIGNGNYQHWAKLRNATNDAEMMAEVLEKLGFEVKMCKDLNKGDFSSCIYEFKSDLYGVNTALFYYAGHGFEYRGKNFLVPCDAQQDNLHIENDCVDVTDLVNEISNEDNFVGIVILDCCREHIEIMRGSNTNPISGFSASQGIFIAFATSPGQSASDGLGSNGLFTEKVCEHIYEEGLKIEDLFKKVRCEIIQENKYKQVPWEHSSLVGDFYFVQPQNKIKELIQQQDCFSKIDALCANQIPYNQLVQESEQVWLGMHSKTKACFIELGIKDKDDFFAYLEDYIDEKFVKED